MQSRTLADASPPEQLRLLREWRAKGLLDEQVGEKVDAIDAAYKKNANQPPGWLGQKLAEIRQILDLEQQAHRLPGGAVQTAQQIKRSPVYRDAGVKQESNWMGDAASRLGNIDCDCNRAARSGSGSGISAVGNAIVYGVYGLLGAALIAFIIYALNKFSWSKKLERRAKALLDDDEPERSLDEWLEMADKLEREGKYREAVRCLYLACLLKIDEARIARFERSQTNWEHLARIEASPRRPEDFHFREPTKAFDEIWYGMRVKGSEDVMRFRAWYREVTDLMRPKAA